MYSERDRDVKDDRDRGDDRDRRENGTNGDDRKGTLISSPIIIGSDSD